MRCFYLWLRKGCGFSTSCNLIPLYNESILFRLTGKLNRVALEQSLNEIIRRHEILRSLSGRRRPTRANRPHLTLTLPVVDLQEIRSIEQETKVKQVATQDSSHPFDLSRGPLLRAPCCG